MRAKGRMRDDRGLAIPLVSLMLVSLLTMSAFAVDVGMVFAERRQAQSAADAGVLAGAWQLLFAAANADGNVFNQVVAASYESLDPMTRPATIDEWRELFFTSCTDPDAAARGYTKVFKVGGRNVDCVRKRADNLALRVKLPTREVDTVLAGVVGYDTLSTGAFAEAGLFQPETNIIPFALTSMNLNSATSCLLSATDGHTEGNDCDGPYQGNFGFLGSPRPTLDSNQNCNGGHSTVIQENTARGLDHFLAALGEGDPEIEDVCEGEAVVPIANTVNLQTGANMGTLEGALIGDGPFEDGLGGRLQRGGCLTKQNIRTGYNAISYCPIWFYMHPFDASDVADPDDSGFDPTTDIPSSCYDVLTDNGFKTKAGMQQCLSDYDAGGYTTDLFTDAINEDARFAWVPEAWEDLEDHCNGNCWFTIKRFRAVWIQSLWLKEGSNIREYNPGQGVGTVSGKNAQLIQMSAFTLNPETLPAAITEAGPVNGIPSITLIR